MEGVDWLRERGWNVRVEETSRPAELPRFSSDAAALGYDCVVACGGDGTLHGALNGVVGTSTALALVPGGTANVWAREAGLPSNPVAALKLVEEGERVRLDTGLVAGEAFLLMASAGLDSLVAGQVDGAMKRHLGPLAYLGRAALELRHFRGLRAELTIDGERKQGTMLGVLAGNTRSYGGVLEITRDARADDGLLDVCLYQGAGRRRFLRHLFETLLGRHLEDASVSYQKARRIEVATERPWPVQADGEVVAHTPVTIECAPRSVTVVVSRGEHSPLWNSAEGDSAEGDSAGGNATNSEERQGG